MAGHTQPLTLGEILDRTVQLYRRNFLLLAGISAPPAGVMVLIFGGAGILLSSQFPVRVQTAPAATNGTSGLIVGLVIGLLFLVGVPILLGTFALSLSATNYAVFRANRGEKITIRAAYVYGFRHFWRHVGILFLQGLLAGVVPYVVFIAIFAVGAIVATLLTKSGAGEAFAPLFAVLLIVLVVALMVVCVWVWLRFSLAFSVSVAEDTRSWPSLVRSGKLSKGTRGRIFVMFLLVAILSGIISLALMIPLFLAIAFAMRKSLAGPNPPPMFLILFQTVYFAVSFLVRAIVMPVYVTALMLFYYDQRVRQEGYDIEELMRQAGWPELPPLAPAAPVAVPATFSGVPEVAGSAAMLPVAPRLLELSEALSESRSEENGS